LLGWLAGGFSAALVGVSADAKPLRKRPPSSGTYSDIYPDIY
jgi:hypothetical protein